MSAHGATVLAQPPCGLSAPSRLRRRLADLIAGVHFGRIELSLRNGTACFDPPPAVAREWLLAVPREQRSAPVQRAPDAAFEELFELLAEIRTGPVTIEIRHGRPHRVLQSLRGAS